MNAVVDGNTTWEICPACGNEAGYEYDGDTSQARLEELRIEWLYQKSGQWWDVRNPPPEDWSANKQMTEARIQIPKRPSVH